MRRCKLVSDGTVRGTTLTNEDGRLIPGITRIEIEPIDVKNNRLTKIKVTMVADLEITGEIADINADKGVFNRKGEKIYGYQKDCTPEIYPYLKTGPILSAGGGGGGGSSLAGHGVGGSSGGDPNSDPSGAGQGRTR